MKKGFTLAEVLITLVVVGVIAGVAVPPLTSKINQKQRNAQLKSAYTQMNEAYRLAADDLGFNPQCGYWQEGGRPEKYENTVTEYNSAGNASWYYYDSEGNKKPLGEDYNGLFRDCEVFGKAVQARLPVAKVCKNECYAAGIIPKYDGNDTVSATNLSETDKYKDMDKDSAEYQAAMQYDTNKNTSGTSGYRQYNLLHYNTMIVLEDGKIIINYMGGQGWFHPRYYAIDINGKKGPNKWGFDLFPFQTNYTIDGQSLEMFTAGSFTDSKLGVTAAEAMKDTLR